MVASVGLYSRHSFISFLVTIVGCVANARQIRVPIVDDTAVLSGDVIYLKANTGGHLALHADGTVLESPPGKKGLPGFFIEKATRVGQSESGVTAAIVSGDVVFLRAHDGRYIDVDLEGNVRASRTEPDDSQTLLVAKPGDGPIRVGDAVVFRAVAGGALLEVGQDGQDAGGIVRARAAVKIQPSHALVVETLPYGSLHDVVGEHGVLMITLEQEGQSRNTHSLDALAGAGIYPIAFPATNVHKAPPGKLHLTCPLETEASTAGWCDEMGRRGQPGCKASIEQAITDSHRRALIAALGRGASESNWTAIIEDDVVPVMPESFDAEFRKAWAGVPDDIGIVRLGWCTFDDLGPIEDRSRSEHGAFRLVSERWWTDAQNVQHYYTGGCTTGYLVRRDFIPEMLQIFPCCCPIDCCLERQLFYAPAFNGTSDEYGKWRGPQVMIDMDTKSTKNYSAGFATFDQSGVLVQDNRMVHSERPEWNHVS